ncbi:MAG: hypothetical protein RMY34_06055 [Aulosira sp. DedQUE10]|nr:hypothetical protein [Aulosira sp. DedQUE10]
MRSLIIQTDDLKITLMHFKSCVEAQHRYLLEALSEHKSVNTDEYYRLLAYYDAYVGINSRMIDILNKWDAPDETEDSLRRFITDEMLTATATETYDGFSPPYPI